MRIGATVMASCSNIMIGSFRTIHLFHKDICDRKAETHLSYLEYFSIKFLNGIFHLSAKLNG